MKKRLLKEETTRRFMKLANLQPLNEDFFQEDVVSENEVQEEGMGMYEEDPEVGMDADADPAPDMDMPDPEDDMSPEDGGCSDDVVSLVSAVAAAIEDATGCSMTVANDEPAEMDMDAPESDEEPVLEQEDTLEEETEVTEENLEEALANANIELVDPDRGEWLVSETLRRVTNRLIEASKKN